MKKIIQINYSTIRKSLLFLIPVLLIGNLSIAQQIVTGTIKDSKGQALSGATITVRGTKSATVADADGNFSISVNVEPPFYLRATYVGHKPQDFQMLRFESTPVPLTLVEDALLEEIVVTARRRTETAQDVPIPVSVIGGSLVTEAGAFNVNRIKELVPSVQLYSSNPRNTGINIRGIGSPFGLTNDGLDPGVGFYVDGVYFARPAAATLDFIDIEQVEVLRGPQGTLFGKNTTAGAFNITSRKASFIPGVDFELSYGNYGYIQAKTSITGPLTKKLAARASFSGTQRNGLVDNVATGKATNDINNIGFRGQLLYKATDNTTITLNGDNTMQRPDGYAQVVAGVVQTKRSAYRQFDAIISDLNYALPSRNAFDRVIDHDTPWNSNNDLGGVSLNIESKIGPGTLTSTSAWRYWDWGPSNDRDFTGLQALALSQNPTKHKNWSQEVRYAGEFSSRLSGVTGLFYINQDLKTTGSEVSGRHQWRFSQSSTSTLWETDSLFEGYGIFTNSSIKSTSAAAFANIDWEAFDGFHIQPGIRFNYDKKDVSYDRQARGGKDFTGDPNETALRGLRTDVYASQFYTANSDENNVTYNLTLSYRPNKRLNTYATYSTSYKPVGVNVAGLPGGANPLLELSVIKPEDVTHYEVGVKTSPVVGATLNVTFFNTDIEDYQANVQSPDPAVNRGYIANAEKVRVRGAELDVSYRAVRNLSFFGALSYTDGKYVTFKNAPLPLEETGIRDANNVQYFSKDISGSRLPGISKWSSTLGGEFSTPTTFFGKSSDFFVAIDAFYRSEFSSSPTPSAFLNVDGYVLANGRLGFRTPKGPSVYIWGRNLLDKDYYEQLLPAGGNAGHYGAVLGDQRTFGITLRQSF